MNISTNKYRPNVAMITIKDGKLLIVHKPRLHDAWQFPQGGVDEGETELEAIKREFQEEIGTNKIINIKPTKIYYEYTFPKGYTRYSDSGKIYLGQRVHFWISEFTGTNLDIKLEPQELDDYRWISKIELSTYFTRKEYLEHCLRCLD